jgi:hypothetical protein
LPLGPSTGLLDHHSVDDTLPSDYCVALEIPAGSTYAQAARHVRSLAVAPVEAG